MMICTVVHNRDSQPTNRTTKCATFMSLDKKHLSRFVVCLLLVCLTELLNIKIVIVVSAEDIV